MSRAHTLSEAPISRRAQNSVKPNLMKEMTSRAMSNVYHPVGNLDGIINVGSAMNMLPLNDLQNFLSKIERNAENGKITYYTAHTMLTTCPFSVPL